MKDDSRDIKEDKLISDFLRETNPLALPNITSAIQNEMRDCIRRECNWIIKGLKETEEQNNNNNNTTESSVITQNNDTDVGTEILGNLKTAANLSKLNLDNIAVKWIGIRKGAKSRHICVGLKSRDDEFAIINNAKLLSGNIQVSNDKTKLQMSWLNQAYDLINKHNEEHPGDKLEVKHVKNVPSLIDDTGKLRDSKKYAAFFRKPLSSYYHNVSKEA